MNDRVHFIGIGGIGMSGIAQLFLQRGVKVSGSDLKDNTVIGELRLKGAQIFIGHQADNVLGASRVVYSSAIKEDNPEMLQARHSGIPLIKRAQALAELMQDKTVITVAGSHGKTTTTSLVSYLLLEAGLCPTAAIGGILRNIDTNACIGDGKYFVAEADESDGSFLYYHPKYSIVTNIDREHLDYYKDFENELRAFSDFLSNTEGDGCVFCCADDPYLKDMVKRSKKRHVLFGLHEGADIYPKEIKLSGLSSEFDCYHSGKFISRFNLAIGGEHNISNALSVIALGLELGIDIAVIKYALASYKGAQRRLEIKSYESDVLIIDDYAHHPTEIRATLEAAKHLKHQRLVAIFQPHRYTRTQLLFNEFAGCFSAADYLLITDIYPASEAAIPGVSAEALCAKIKEFNPDKLVTYLTKAQICDHILRMMRPGDLIMTLGAGDIIKICDELVERIKKH